MDSNCLKICFLCLLLVSKTVFGRKIYSGHRQQARVPNAVKLADIPNTITQHELEDILEKSTNVPIRPKIISKLLDILCALCKTTDLECKRKFCNRSKKLPETPYKLLDLIRRRPMPRLPSPRQLDRARRPRPAAMY